MILTKKPQWKLAEVYRGVEIYRRVSGTGTCGGGWIIPGSYFNTLKATKAYIEQNAHFINPLAGKQSPVSNP